MGLLMQVNQFVIANNDELIQNKARVILMVPEEYSAFEFDMS